MRAQLQASRKPSLSLDRCRNSNEAVSIHIEETTSIAAQSDLLLKSLAMKAMAEEASLLLSGFNFMCAQ
jgi:hypothetical protein